MHRFDFLVCQLKISLSLHEEYITFILDDFEITVVLLLMQF